MVSSINSASCVCMRSIPFIITRPTSLLPTAACQRHLALTITITIIIITIIIIFIMVMIITTITILSLFISYYYYHCYRHHHHHYLRHHCSLHPPRIFSFSSGGQLVSIFAGYVSLASQSPYPIIVYSVAIYRAHLSHFWLRIFLFLNPCFIPQKLPKMCDPIQIVTLLKK